MKNMKLTKSLTGIAAMVSLSFAPAVLAAESCKEIADKVTVAVTAEPNDVLKVVTEQVSANPTCACEVVKAAIKASKADKTLVVQIVEAAASSAPEQLPAVLTCAAKEAPEASSDLIARFGDETEGSGKGVVGKGSIGKEPPPVEESREEDEGWDFGLLRPGVGGIYLSAPSGGFVGGSSEIVETRVIRTTERRTVHVPIFVPVTPTVPRD